MTGKLTGLGVGLRRVFSRQARTVTPTARTRTLRIWQRAEAATKALAIVFVLGAFATPVAQAQTFTVLHSFTYSDGG